MLTFLQKIRKPLIESGSVRKYLLFAIGEILLVMIGILLALQVNNWNIQRQERILEDQYLNRLRQELLENMESIDSQRKWEKNQESSARLLLSSLNISQSNVTSQTLSKAIIRSGWTHNRDLITKVLDELVIGGNIRYIRNSQLREKLKDLRTYIDQMNSLNEEFNSFNLGFRRLVGNVLDGELRVEISTAMFDGVENMPKGVEWPNADSLIDELKSIDGIEGYLADIIQGRILIQRFHNDHKERFINLIELIEKQGPKQGKEEK